MKSDRKGKKMKTPRQLASVNTPGWTRGLSPLSQTRTHKPFACSGPGGAAFVSALIGGAGFRCSGQWGAGFAGSRFGCALFGGKGFGVQGL